MSQDYHHQGVFSFSHGGFDRSQPEQYPHHIAQLRLQGFDPLDGGIPDESGALPVYEPAMLSEMFNFPSSTATELLENQILQGYRNSRVGGAPTPDLYTHRQQHQISAISADSAAAMQLFLMNPQQRSPPSPSPSNPPLSTSSTPNMLPPNPSTSNSTIPGRFGQFTWAGNGNEIQGIVEGHGLSLSLSSSLQNQGRINHNQASLGTVYTLRNSKYAKAAQELLEEFCCVRRGQLKKNKIPKANPPNSNSSSSKDIPPLSSADRLEHQRRKVKLLSMLDEVDRRYNHYREQMQMMVNSLDMVMGLGAAEPYTCLAQKAMSRHFRCLKDAIAAELKQSYEALGEKDGGGSSLTKGETPRLRILEQRLRQQRGMVEHEAWRPQRGLPERSVNILRAWLFEHFLHPYPSDADKHLLARQTSLSRNQVSNWFINARVRLWKPMVEEMYQQEAKDADQDNEETDQNAAQTPSATMAPPPHETDPPYSTIHALSKDDVATPSTHEHALQPPLIRFGTSSGDVSLTLGLRHAGNMPEKSPFSVTGFGRC